MNFAYWQWCLYLVLACRDTYAQKHTKKLRRVCVEFKTPRLCQAAGVRYLAFAELDNEFRFGFQLPLMSGPISRDFRATVEKVRLLDPFKIFTRSLAFGKSRSSTARILPSLMLRPAGGITICTSRPAAVRF